MNKTQTGALISTLILILLWTRTFPKFYKTPNPDGLAQFRALTEKEWIFVSSIYIIILIAGGLLTYALRDRKK